MPLISVNGIRLNAAIEGEGPPLLLLHGLGSSIASLGAEIEHFRPHRRIIAIDARGHGGSDRPARFTIQDHIADVVAVLDALGIAKCALLGRSMGSYIAQGAAAAAPERIGDLVLVVPRAHASESSMIRLRRHYASELQGRSRQEQRRILLGHMLAPSTPARMASLLAALAEKSQDELSGAGEEAAMAATAAFDFRAVLPRITARTLVVSGRHDWLNPPEEGALIASLIPGARQAVLEHSGHLPAVEERECYLALIASFLSAAHSPDV
ncbi:MAG: alpha/beta fold hydrolase [Rhodomicrobium sp.]